MNEDPIEIKILNEEPVTPELGHQNKALGKQVAQTAVSIGKKGWHSKVRKNVTRSFKKGATAVAAKSSQMVQERVVKAAEAQAKAQLETTKERIRQTDWKAEAQKGMGATLRWVSRKLTALSKKFQEPK